MSFNFDSGVFPDGPPQIVSEIYPLLGFEPSLECDPKTTIPVLITRANAVNFRGSPLLEFHSLKHIQPDDFISTGNASPVRNACRVWLPSWRSSSFQPLKPCFMLKALMGFPSQSLLPDLKPQLLIGLLLLPCPLVPGPRTAQ